MTDSGFPAETIKWAFVEMFICWKTYPQVSGKTTFLKIDWFLCVSFFVC